VFEPIVTLTDWALALECALFAALLAHRQTAGAALRRWWVVFFASASAAPLLGGTVHGFFPQGSSGHGWLWPPTLLAVGATALCGWAIGARLCFRRPVAHWIVAAAAVQFVVYAALVLCVTQSFGIAVAVYVPAALFLWSCLIAIDRRQPARPLRQAAWGVLITLAAGGGQQLRIGLHPTWFDHNAVYHVVQGVALFLVFRGARWLVDASAALEVAHADAS